MKYLLLEAHTLPNFRVCAWQKVLVKHFTSEFFIYSMLKHQRCFFCYSFHARFPHPGLSWYFKRNFSSSTNPKLWRSVYTKTSSYSTKVNSLNTGIWFMFKKLHFTVSTNLIFWCSYLNVFIPSEQAKKYKIIALRNMDSTIFWKPISSIPN